MNTYLVEYEVYWAKLIIDCGVEEVTARTKSEAEMRVRNKVRRLNKRATVIIGDIVEVE